MAKYRAKPIVVEAFRLPVVGDDNVEPFLAWAHEVGLERFTSGRDETLELYSFDMTLIAKPGDWIIKGVTGEFYPCKPDVFGQLFEPVE